MDRSAVAINSSISAVNETGEKSLGVVSRTSTIYKDVDIEELTEKDRLVINKARLRRWFEQLPMTDRPTFLFDEERENLLPDVAMSPNGKALLARFPSRRFQFSDRLLA